MVLIELLALALYCQELLARNDLTIILSMLNTLTRHLFKSDLSLAWINRPRT